MMNSKGIVRSVKDRKCYFINTDILFFLILLTLKLVVNSSAHQTDKGAVENNMPFDGSLGHGINKVHEVHIIEGVMQKGHPIVVYKEEFGNEKIDPNRHKMFIKKKKFARHLRHNSIKHYNALKTEKIYFDILPQKPILMNNGDKDASNAKFVAELLPLVDKLEITKNGNLVVSNRRKRDIIDSKAKHPEQSQLREQKKPSLWHDSNPKNFDFSQYDNPKQNAASDSSLNKRQTNGLAFRTNKAPFSATTSSPLPTSPKVTNCTWAIVNCCGETNDIPYNCFEEFSCHGAFWGTNPCSDKVFQNAVSHMYKTYG